MSPRIFEIPRRLALVLQTVGPIHEDPRDQYHYSVSLVLARDGEPAGFLIEQRLAERTLPPVPAGQGISFGIPARPDPASEPTFIYTETLAEALAYIQRIDQPA